MKNAEVMFWATEVLDKLCDLGLKDFLRIGTQDQICSFMRENEDKMAQKGIYAAFGETKVAIWDEDYKYVIKLPFLNRKDGSMAFDYCKAEWRNFLKAKEIGIDNHFAEMARVGWYLGYPIYVMEYIDIDEERTSSTVYDYMYGDSEEDCCDPCDSEESILDYCSSIWDNYDQIADFLDRNLINDLHAGNVGWRGEELVMCDYSGYGMIARALFDDDWWTILGDNK